MKNELMRVWYYVTFMVNENSERREYSIFCQGSSENCAAVSAVVGIFNGEKDISNPAFKSIRKATCHEAEQLDNELSAVAAQEESKLGKDDE